MAENVYMYYEKKMDKNVNMKQEVKSIIPKIILKCPNFETIGKDPEEAEVNLKKDSNPYQYNVVDDFC